MKYRGKFVNGVVLLPPGTALPEGSTVEVVSIAEGQCLASGSQPDEPTLARTFEKFIGVFDDLPADLADNHDHYVHGVPKK